MRIEREPLQKFPMIVAVLSVILCGVGVVWRFKNNLVLFMIRNGSFERLVQDARDWLRLPLVQFASSPHRTSHWHIRIG